MSGCSCGHQLSEGDRFCSQCGQAVFSMAGAASQATGPEGPLAAGTDSTNGELLLFDSTSNGSVETSSEVRSGFPVRWGVLGALAVLAMMWGLYAWPQGEVPQEADEAADALDADVGSDETSTSTTDPDDDDLERPDRAAEAEAVEDRSSTSTSEAAGAGDDADSEDDQPGSLVGEATGYWLAVGNFDSGRPMRLVSLDTGKELELPAVRGRPIGMIGTTLVAADWSYIATIDLAADELEAVTILSDSDGWIESVHIDDGVIWTVAGFSNGEAPRLIGRSVDGDEVDSLDFSIGNLYSRTPGNRDLATSTAGGVYIRTASGPERLSTGRLRAIGDEIVLIDECDDRMRCASNWYRRGTWERMDLPSPPSSDLGASSIGGGDRWLATTDYQNGATALIKVETGEIERTVSGGEVYGPYFSLPISDDGRWLFDWPMSGDGAIIDLDSGKEWPVDLNLRDDSAIEFIDLSGVGLRAE